MERPALPRTAALLTPTAALLTGCATSTPTGPFPPRPADIDIATIDPCTALTPGEQTDRGVDPGEPSTGDLGDGPTRICGWSNFDDGYNYSVQTTPVPAAVTVGSPESVVREIGGYGVVQVTAYTTSVPLCMYYVDTSDVMGIRTLTQATTTATAQNPTICAGARRSSRHRWYRISGPLDDARSQL